MTWQLSTTAPADEVAAALSQAASTQLEDEPFDSWDDNVAEQMRVAGEAAQGLAKLVDGEHGVNVYAHGHIRRNDYESNIAVTVQAVPAPIVVEP